MRADMETSVDDRAASDRSDDRQMPIALEVGGQTACAFNFIDELACLHQINLHARDVMHASQVLPIVQSFTRFSLHRKCQSRPSL